LLSIQIGVPCGYNTWDRYRAGSQSGKDRDWDILFAFAFTCACDGFCHSSSSTSSSATKRHRDHIHRFALSSTSTAPPKISRQDGQLAQARERQREAARAHNWLGGERGCKAMRCDRNSMMSLQLTGLHSGGRHHQRRARAHPEARKTAETDLGRYPGQCTPVPSTCERAGHLTPAREQETATYIPLLLKLLAKSNRTDALQWSLVMLGDLIIGSLLDCPSYGQSKAPEYDLIHFNRQGRESSESRYRCWSMGCSASVRQRMSLTVSTCAHARSISNLDSQDDFCSLKSATVISLLLPYKVQAVALSSMY
jgi:hypothetical protein